MWTGGPTHPAVLVHDYAHCTLRRNHPQLTASPTVVAHKFVVPKQPCISSCYTIRPTPVHHRVSGVLSSP